MHQGTDAGFVILTKYSAQQKVTVYKVVDLDH